MPPTREQVLEAIQQVYDPEIPVNIVDLGLIYDVEVQEGVVKVVMTLTTPTCGMSRFIAKEVQERVEELEGVRAATVEITLDPPWEPSRMSEAAVRMLGGQ